MKKPPLPPLFFLKDKKAISSILAGVLLIIIVLVIAGLFFIFSRGMFSTLSITRDFEILDANIMLDSSGSATLQITVKNTGNGKITISNAVVQKGATPPTVSINVNLDPGQITGKVSSISGVSFTAGEKVIVKVSATYDSTTIEKMTQVIVQG